MQSTKILPEFECQGQRSPGTKKRKTAAFYFRPLMRGPPPVLRRWENQRMLSSSNNKNSSGDEIANENFFYNIAHVEASAYAH